MKKIGVHHFLENYFYYIIKPWFILFQSLVLLVLGLDVGFVVRDLLLCFEKTCAFLETTMDRMHFHGFNPLF